MLMVGYNSWAESEWFQLLPIPTSGDIWNWNLGISPA